MSDEQKTAKAFLLLIPVVAVVAMEVCFAACGKPSFTTDYTACLDHFIECCKYRVTRNDMRTLLSKSEKEMREATARNPDAVLPMFERLKTERVVRARFASDYQKAYFLPRLADEPIVPASFMSGLLEDVLIRFGGNGFPDAATQGRIKKLIAFAEELEPTLPEADARTLHERLLDAHFVVNDFDGAVSILEKGLAGHSDNWCKAAIAKIRAHQAEEKKDYAEALKQFVAFGEAMAAEPDKGIPEFDPSSGVAYCRAWVLAKNARRCSEYAKKIGRDEDSAAFLAKAKELYAKAVEDTADDDKSLAVLKKEIAEAGL